MRIGRFTSRLSSNARFGRDITLRRTAESNYDANGRWLEGAATETPLVANVQPATARQREVLPEGDREMEAIAVVLETYNRGAVLPIKSGSTLQDADSLVVGGVVYIVRDVADRSIHGHLEIVATREEGQ